jgi:hypothetical protein
MQVAAPPRLTGFKQMQFISRLLRRISQPFSQPQPPTATEREGPASPPEPRLCLICRRQIDVAGEPLSADTGGDCWGCVSEIEAGMVGAPLDDYRQDPRKWTGRDATRSRPGEESGA